MYDIAILGGGPAGYTAAQRAAAKGLSVILFEKKELGGVCLNEGCIPTKTLLHSAKLLDSARSADKFGVKIDGASVEYDKLLARKEKVIKKLVGAIKVSMRNHEVEVIKENAEIKGGTKGDFTIAAAGVDYQARNILLCTGSHTFEPKIEWLEGVKDKMITSREALELSEIPGSVAIVGGGVIGMEFASLFNSLGSSVTIFETMDEVLGTFDAELASALRKTYEAKGVKFYLSGDEAGKEATLQAEKILLCIGRRPNVEGIGIEKVGLKADERGRICTDDRMRTAVDGIYAAGDITGQYMLAHCASREGEVAVNDILGIADSMRYIAVPSVVYTKPEIAAAGLTERLAASQGLDYECNSLPLTYSGRFVAETERENGLCKIVFERESRRVLGVQILGGPASEIISACCVAIENGMTIEDIQKVIFPHPSVSEILKEVAFK